MCRTIRSAAERRRQRAFGRVAALRQGAAAGCRSLSGSMPFGLPRHVLFSGRSLRSARMLAKAAGCCAITQLLGAQLAKGAREPYASCGPSLPKAAARRALARIGSRAEACGAPVSTDAGLRCGRLRPAALTCDSCSEHSLRSTRNERLRPVNGYAIETVRAARTRFFAPQPLFLIPRRPILKNICYICPLKPTGKRCPNRNSK